jgi:glycolate oxidase
MYDPKTHFLNLHELVTAARINLSQNAWDYLYGATESETSVRRNRQALDSLALRPRVLTDVSHVDPSTTFFGRKVRIPVAFAPVGSLETFEEGGGASVAKAAAEFGGISIHSSVSQPGLEKTAEAAPDGYRIFQLYVRGDDAYVDDFARRAIANGYRLFVITVDVQHYSRRERDLANRWVKRWVRNRSGMEHQMSFDWDKVKRFKDKHDIPLGIKGISHPDDAARAAELGCEIVWVSNHGGRQLDHMEGTIAVLPEMVRAVEGRARIIIDGGFQRGTDVIKALCLGADLVAMGRLMVCALAAAGKEGVLRAFELLEDELTRDLGLMGVNSVAELNPGFVRPAAPVAAPDVFGGFPLLRLPEQRY